MRRKFVAAAMLLASSLALSCGDAYYDVIHGNMPNLLPSDIKRVTYDGNGSVSGLPPIDLHFYLQNQGVVVQGNPWGLSKTGYSYIGWNTAADGSGTFYIQGDTFTIGTDSVVLYAMWTINQYTVDFDSLGGTPVPSQTIEYNSLVAMPADPVKTGYTFASWYRDPGFVTPWLFASDRVEGNTTIHALWTVNQYTVSFDPQGGSSVAKQLVNYGGYVIRPADPVKTINIFEGWHRDLDFLIPWDFFVDTVEGNTTLYAKWREETALWDSAIWDLHKWSP